MSSRAGEAISVHIDNKYTYVSMVCINFWKKVTCTMAEEGEGEKAARSGWSVMTGGSTLG